MSGVGKEDDIKNRAEGKEEVKKEEHKEDPAARWKTTILDVDMPAGTEAD